MRHLSLCDLRNSPGVFSAPRPLSRRIACISRSNRFERGKPSRKRRKPCVIAATYRETSVTSASGTPGASPSSWARRSSKVDCVPSICDDRTASFRWNVYRSRRTSGSVAAAPSSLPSASSPWSSALRTDPSSCSGGSGSSGAGTNARTFSPPAVLTAYRPMSVRLMRSLIKMLE